MTKMTTANLHSSAAGICGTHVTWEDIEHGMQVALKTSATFGPKKTAKNGFLSKICLIEPNWQNKEGDEELPEKFIAKLPTAIALVELSNRVAKQRGVEGFMTKERVQHFEKKVRKFHNNEVQAYRLLDEYMIDKVPRVKALRAIAALESFTDQLTDEEMVGFSETPLREIVTLFDKASIDRMGSFLRGIGGSRMEEKINELVKIIPEVLDIDWMESIPKQLGMKEVICHGDLWSTNLLWREKDGKQSIAAMIDFQTFHLGNPAGDISRLLLTNLSGEDRKKQYELLNVFYKFLTEELDDLPVPYTLDQLKEAYKRYLPIAGLMLVPMVAALFGQQMNIMAEEDRVTAKEIMTEKMETIIQDILDMHTRNKTIRKAED